MSNFGSTYELLSLKSDIVHEKDRSYTSCEMLDDFFEQRRLRSAVIEGKAVEIWAEVVGEYVAQYTEDVYIRAGILYVTMSSAAVRSEIHIRRRHFVTLINERIGTKAVRNIIVR